MRISLLCSGSDHPINRWLGSWMEKACAEHDVRIFRDKSELSGGDVLFLVSCSQLIGPDIRAKFRHVLVLHASDLPRGRGWSPHVWEILGGAEKITVSLLSAEDSVDSGAIWAQCSVLVPPHLLCNEINERLFEAELALMDQGISMISQGLQPNPQDLSVEPSYYRKRTPDDSEIDPKLSLMEQFNAIRVADPQRYPAFFRLYGHKYTLEIKRVDESEELRD